MEAAIEQLLGSVRLPPAQRPFRFDPLRAREEKRQQLLKRRQELENESLRLYEPLPLSARFHACNALWRICDGSNRAGKSLACAVEAARAFTGSDPHRKYPKADKQCKALLVGLELKHITLIYQMLFEQGAFQIIQDEHTRKWRTVRWDRAYPTRLQEYDEAYREKWKDAPPLIPKRFIVGNINWEKTGIVPRSIQIANWDTLWLSAAGKPDQGSHLNFVLFDEEMPNPEHYKEAHRGLTRLWETVRQRPKGVWPATSQVANPELADLRDKAIADPDSDFVQQFHFLVEDNAYLTPAARQEFYDGLSEQDRQTRFHGVPSICWHSVYPQFDAVGVNGCEPFDIPETWARWVVLDPGRTHCGTIFIAIDPNEQYHTIYDAFDLRQGDGHDWAAEVKKREGSRKFTGFICDQQRGKQNHDAEHNQTQAEQYWTCLRAAGVVPQIIASGDERMAGFYPGSNDVEARELAMKNMMKVRQDGPFAGTAKWRVVRGACPELEKQIRRAHTDPKNPDKRFKDKSQPADCVEAAEYGAAFDPRYHAPEKVVPEKTVDMYASWKAERRFKANRRRRLPFAQQI